MSVAETILATTLSNLDQLQSSSLNFLLRL